MRHVRIEEEIVDQFVKIIPKLFKHIQTFQSM